MKWIERALKGLPASWTVFAFDKLWQSISATWFSEVSVSVSISVSFSYPGLKVMTCTLICVSHKGQNVGFELRIRPASQTAEKSSSQHANVASVLNFLAYLLETARRKKSQKQTKQAPLSPHLALAWRQHTLYMQIKLRTKAPLDHLLATCRSVLWFPHATPTPTPSPTPAAIVTPGGVFEKTECG